MNKVHILDKDDITVYNRRTMATRELLNVRDTARTLGVHENTVAYRVRRVLELTGQQDAGSLVLRAAVELLPLMDDDEREH